MTSITKVLPEQTWVDLTGSSEEGTLFLVNAVSDVLLVNAPTIPTIVPAGNNPISGVVNAQIRDSYFFGAGIAKVWGYSIRGAARLTVTAES
jgi:hypothetical protein